MPVVLITILAGALIAASRGWPPAAGALAAGAMCVAGVAIWAWWVDSA